MKTVNKFLIGISVTLLLMIAAIFADYSINNKVEVQEFYFDIYLNDFITNYLGIQQNEERNTLLVGECEHAVSKDGLKPDLTKWRLEDSFEFLEDDFFFVDNTPNPIYTPPLFFIDNWKYIGYGQNFKITIANYTSHPHTFWFEKKIGEDWQQTNDIKIFKEDKVNHIFDYDNSYYDSTGFDFTEVDYWIDGDPSLNSAKFGGSKIKYHIAGKDLSVGNYRVIASTDKHGEFVSEFEIVKNRPLQWEIKKEDFFNPDSLIITLKNTSGERFYHVSWNRETPVIFKGTKVYKNGEVQEEQVDLSYDCGTGLSMLPVYDGEKISFAYHDPYTYYQKIDEQEFNTYFRETYGDSVTVRFYLPVYKRMYFSRYEDQYVISPEFTFNTEELLSKWTEYRKNQGETHPKFSQLIK